MCGIVGIITKSRFGFDKTEQRMLAQLLYADALRGGDATGVITCHNNGDFGIMKEASTSAQFLQGFMDSDLDKDLFKNGFAAIGHNRASTIGADIDVNAHPFVEDATFAMVHNGTLHNHKKMHDTDVDSHALTIAIKRAFDEDDWKTALETQMKDVYGAYACVWYDQKRDQVGILRNSDRPLSIVETAKSYIICSESTLGSWIASRNGEKVVKIETVTPSVLYTFKNDKGGAAVQTPLTLRAQYTSGTTTSTAHTASTPGSQKHGGTSGSKANSGGPFRKFVQRDSGKTDKRSVISKNGYKKFRKESLGDFIKFVRDINTLVADTPSTYHMVGACESIPFKHVVRCTVDAEDFAFNAHEMDFHTVWEGFINDCHYARDGTVTIFLDVVSPAYDKVPEGTLLC